MEPGHKPLTNEQIWGLPEEQLPQPEAKDFFDFTTDGSKPAKNEKIDDRMGKIAPQPRIDEQNFER